MPTWGHDDDPSTASAQRQQRFEDERVILMHVILIRHEQILIWKAISISGLSRGDQVDCSRRRYGKSNNARAVEIERVVPLSGR